MNGCFWVLSVLLLTTTAAMACEASDIAVDKTRGRVDGAYLRITGRILNNCSDAVGVKIKIVVYDKTGEILAVRDTWPASARNIPARSDFPFEKSVQRVPGYSKFDVRVVSVNRF